MKKYIISVVSVVLVVLMLVGCGAGVPTEEIDKQLKGGMWLTSDVYSSQVMYNFYLFYDEDKVMHVIFNKNNTDDRVVREGTYVISKDVIKCDFGGTKADELKYTFENNVLSLEDEKVGILKKVNMSYNKQTGLLEFD